MRIISACSPSVGIAPAFARSKPMASMSTGFMGRNARTFTDLAVRSTESRNSGNVTQSQGMPSCIDLSGIASVRTMVSIARSRESGCTGAKPNPQFPMTTLVTPCHPDNEQYGSQKSCAS